MKKIQKLVQSVLMVLALGALSYSASLRAEDIDIYLDNATQGELPNVLFVIDNSSNIASTWSQEKGCAAYADGGAPSLGTDSAGGIVQCALVDTINSLPDGRMKVGIMTGNANGFGTSKGCVGDEGGCVLYPLTEINAATRPALIAFIKKWKQQNSGETETTYPFTVNNAETDGMMQESWAYYNGRVGLSGRSYTENQLYACQKNFIIYIGNMDKSPSNEGLAGTTALTSAGATGDLLDKITKTQVFDPAICGTKNITSFPAGSSSSDWSSNWGDEWARFMFEKDGGTSTMEGSQNIITYTIGIINNDEANACTADYPALMQSMAVVGGGKPYRVSDAGEVKDALAEALNEVQAVNSVFSSASLPVSVNAEGSYLNQIFLGMFRPDSTGAPRWAGNLKQYQLVRNSAGQLVMGDAEGRPAITSGGTGFLTPGAVSFWTYRDDANEPDEGGGFFRSNPQGTPESPFDSPDGEVVEKGGVAQQLRKQSLTADFLGASGTALTNPRRVFTFCPGGEPCQDELTHADNDFATSNAKIVATDFGATVTVPVVSIVRTGTTALVTTSGNHGFTSGSVVTIRNAHQSEYNKTQVVTVNSATTFTITGLPDYPTTPATVGYTISVPGTAGTFDIVSVQRSAAAVSSETVTVTTSADHPYVVGQTVQISGVSPALYYGGNKTITAVPTARTFQFTVPIHPVSPTVNAYTAAYPDRGATISSITPFASYAEVITQTAHGFHDGQSISISNVKRNNASGYNGTWTVTVVNATTFRIARPASNANAVSGQGTASVLTTAQTVSISRESSAESTRAIVTGLPASWFATGDTVSIATGGSSPNESAYIGNFTITCVAADCSSFSYPITATPPVAGTVSGGKVSIPGAGATADIPAGNITRSGSTATAIGVPGGVFFHGSVVEIQPTSGTVLNTEAGYVGSWQINCGADTTCSSFTFGAVPLTPATPATGVSIQAYSSNTAPDKNMLIKWLRGHDNQADEQGPGGDVTVRPSVHGDVLHSRPLVINYGDSRGIVVFYGSNDGVYRAINGNQTESIATGGITVPAGGELWGLILPEHYQLINRYRSNSPELKFPGTFLSTAQPKDYFVDGPTGVYQKLRADGTIERAIIYLTMRRGGRFIYALDVTQPAAPRYLWSISHQSTGFEELGQTWSRPRLTLLQNYTVTDVGTGVTTHVPVLVFGAGYDPAQDFEPPATNTMGRGIFVIDAIEGTKVFSASISCPTTSETCRNVSNMKYATPSDISFVDRDLDGFTDKFYWGDLGGNVWRADVADALVQNWTVNRVAQFGCNTGECSVMTTPRKFFFPPAVLSVRAAGAVGSYDALSIVSGDREHPLRSDSPHAAFNVKDRFFMVKDLGTAVNVTTLNTRDVTASDTDLFNATYSGWDGSKNGFYIDFIGAAWNEDTDQPDSTKTPTPGEKAVNAPVAVNGQIFFSTNQPKDADATCKANLGTARSYAVNPFTGAQVQNELAGGGLPPSAVSGLISITETVNGEQVTTQEKFCIGCGVSGKDLGGTNEAPCTSALENCNIGTVIPKNLKRTYWYKK